jgi:hypothetical protein
VGWPRRGPIGLPHPQRQKAVTVGAVISDPRRGEIGPCGGYRLEAAVEAGQVLRGRRVPQRERSSGETWEFDRRTVGGSKHSDGRGESLCL